jgi:hypothetical protein
MFHYTYITRAIDGRYYIGVRSCECDPIDDPYMGSYTDTSYSPTRKRILSLFDFREDAEQHEIYLHTLRDVAINPRYANKAKHTSTGFSTFGTSLSNEHRKKLSEAKKDKKRKPFTDETRRKISESSKGKSLSDETRKKLSTIHTGKNLTDEHKRKIGEANKGRILSDDSRKKISEAGRTRKHGEEARRKISEARKGKRWFYDPKPQKTVFCHIEDCPNGYLPGRGFSTYDKFVQKN